MLKPTQGPWKAELDLPHTGHCGIAITSPLKDYNIANVYLCMMDSAWKGKVISQPENEEARANAALIAAAPDLLAFAELVAAGHLTKQGFVDAADRVLTRNNLSKATVQS